MSQQMRSQINPLPSPSLTPAPSGLLQRKCSCGKSASLTGQCSECERKKLVSERDSTDEENTSEAPVVHEALRSPIPAIQPKLKIGQPNDKYEQEADRIADQVMGMPAPSVQRQITPEDEEEKLVQRKTISSPTSLNSGLSSTEAPPIVHNVLNSPGQPLDSETRTFMESRFRHDFSRVKIHAGKQAAESAQAVDARAFTVGQNIVFDSGQYQPRSSEGQRLLAHELTHVMQQRNSTPQVQRSLEGCQQLIGQPSLRGLLTGNEVHKIIQNHFKKTVKNAEEVRIPGASSTPLRTQGLCGTDASYINPQRLGGQAGDGIPDIAKLNLGSALLVGEIKPATLPCLIDGELQLGRYIAQGNGQDQQQVDWRRSLGIKAVSPILERTFPAPQLSAGKFKIRTAWCTPGLLGYSVDSKTDKRKDKDKDKGKKDKTKDKGAKRKGKAPSRGKAPGKGGKIPRSRGLSRGFGRVAGFVGKAASVAGTVAQALDYYYQYQEIKAEVERLSKAYEALWAEYEAIRGSSRPPATAQDTPVVTTPTPAPTKPDEPKKTATDIKKLVQVYSISKGRLTTKETRISEKELDVSYSPLKFTSLTPTDKGIYHILLSQFDCGEVLKSRRSLLGGIHKTHTFEGYVKRTDYEKLRTLLGTQVKMIRLYCGLSNLPKDSSDKDMPEGDRIEVIFSWIEGSVSEEISATCEGAGTKGTWNCSYEGNLSNLRQVTNGTSEELPEYELVVNLKRVVGGQTSNWAYFISVLDADDGLSDVTTEGSMPEGVCEENRYPGDSVLAYILLHYAAGCE